MNHYILGITLLCAALCATTHAMKRPADREEYEKINNDIKNAHDLAKKACANLQYDWSNEDIPAIDAEDMFDATLSELGSRPRTLPDDKKSLLNTTQNLLYNHWTSYGKPFTQELIYDQLMAQETDPKAFTISCLQLIQLITTHCGPKPSKQEEEDVEQNKYHIACDAIFHAYVEPETEISTLTAQCHNLHPHSFCAALEIVLGLFLDKPILSDEHQSLLTCPEQRHLQDLTKIKRTTETQTQMESTEMQMKVQRLKIMEELTEMNTQNPTVFQSNCFKYLQLLGKHTIHQGWELKYYTAWKPLCLAYNDPSKDLSEYIPKVQLNNDSFIRLMLEKLEELHYPILPPEQRALLSSEIQVLLHLYCAGNGKRSDIKSQIENFKTIDPQELHTACFTYIQLLGKQPNAPKVNSCIMYANLYPLTH